ncbi:MAG: FxsA family protein [bacterium]
MRVLVGMMLWLLAEIAAFVVVGSWIGVLATLALVVGTGLAGVLVLRWQGSQTVQALRGQVLSRASLAVVAHSGLTVVGAVLLILPGFLSDLAGLALMVPAVRRLVMQLVGARVQVVQAGAAPVDVVEGTAVEVEQPRLPSGWTRD